MIKDRLYIYGGKNTTLNSSGDIWVFYLTSSRWEKISPKEGPRPPKLDSHCSTLVTNVKSETEIYYFGGFFGETAKFSRSIFSFNPVSEKWTLVFEKNNKLGKKQNIPQKRANSAICAVGQNLYIFGGNNNNIRFNDLWRFSLTDNSWLRIEAKGEAPIVNELIIISHVICLKN